MFSGDMVGSLGKLGSANGWSAVVSALGGVNRDDKTLTRSAIGDNIALEIKTHEIPTALSRDTAHSNANVQRYDKAEYEDRLETAQLIGDISQNQIDIEWTPKVREAEAKRQQAEAVLNNQNATAVEKAEARQIKSQSEQIIATYGKGGDYQLAVRAVTGVLQGLVTGNQNAAWVNGLSPYANNLIKTYTTDESGEVNQSANLMAHAMLGALEAYATGNHAAAGAAGAITSEVAAKLITEQLYHTAPDKLTDDQKQVVATLSQVTAGLAGIVTSDSTQSAVSAAEIGKRAVENNSMGMALGGYQVANAIARNNTNCDEACKQALDELQKNVAQAQLGTSAGIMTVVLGPEIAGSSVLISGSASAISEVVGQLIETNGDLSSVDWTKVGISTAVGVVTKDLGISGTAVVNTLTEMGDSALRMNEDVFTVVEKSGITFITTLGGGYIGKRIEKLADAKYNPISSKYEFKTVYVPYPIEIQRPKSIVPSVLGNTVDNLSTLSLETYLDHKVKEWKDEK
ncbi:VENN motif pre-toxin domain-containing protein [Actinobacillus sp. GY-402]|nr:VENN motif pre-toxin domain-containing protein [Actinobacillus sp. GY-402]